MTLTTLTLRSVLRCIVMTLTLLAISASAQITPLSVANTTCLTTNYGGDTTPHVVSPSQMKTNFKKGNCNDEPN